MVKLANDPQVVIIGAGPTGLSAAILLALRGVEVVVFERNAGLSTLPQAHVINTRSMELLREMGVEDEVRAASAAPQRMRAISWCESLAGRRFGAISFASAPPEVLMARLSASPSFVANCAQNKVEPILLQRACDLGVDVRFGTFARVTGQDGDGVCLALGAPEEAGTMRADAVIACDGAASRTRGDLGIDMIGPRSLQTYIGIYFRGDLDPWLGDLPGPVQWILGSEVRGFLIGFDIQTSWAFMMPYAPPHTPGDFTKEVCEAVLYKAIGSQAAALEIDSISHWNMSAQVADRFRQGRVFLAGDSAHRFPPTGGLGLNTGLQDAHNLAWKLAAVLGKDAPETLLDSYEAERQPVARFNCEQSVSNALKMTEVERAIGLSTAAPVDPAVSRTRTSPLLELGLDGDTPAAIAKREDVASAIADQLQHFDFLGLDLGFSYTGPAIVGGGAPAAPLNVHRYVPSTMPGTRLPHVWMQRAGKSVSSIDLTAGRFTLLAGRDAIDWVQIARSLMLTQAPGLQILQIGQDALSDPEGKWEGLFGLTAEQALLVRPDGHIAWRSPIETPDRAAILTDVFALYWRQPVVV